MVHVECLGHQTFGAVLKYMNFRNRKTSNMAHMSIEERGRAVGMIVAGTSLRQVIVHPQTPHAELAITLAFLLNTMSLCFIDNFWPDFRSPGCSTDVSQPSRPCGGSSRIPAPSTTAQDSLNDALPRDVRTGTWWCPTSETDLQFPPVLQEQLSADTGDSSPARLYEDV